MAPKSKSSSTSAGKERTNNMMFVNYDLTLEDKKALQKADPSSDDILSTATMLTKEGYKVSLGWDSYSDCVQAFLIGAGEATANHGYILTARSPSGKKALAALFFKHTIVFKGIWHDRVVSGHPDDDY
jgi:hypothetical protein